MQLSGGFHGVSASGGNSIAKKHDTGRAVGGQESCRKLEGCRQVGFLVIFVLRRSISGAAFAKSSDYLRLARERHLRDTFRMAPGERRGCLRVLCLPVAPDAGRNVAK